MRARLLRLLLLAVASISASGEMASAGSNRDAALDEVRSLLLVVGRPPEVGAGFFVSPAGHVLTAAHVLARPEIGATVSLRQSDDTVVSGTVLDLDNDDDLALIATGRGSGPPLGFLAEHEVESGTLLDLAGHPYSFDEGWRFFDVTTLSFRDKNAESLILEGNVFGGHSGGPVLHWDARQARFSVVGMMLARLDPKTGDTVARATPATRIVDFLRSNDLHPLGMHGDLGDIEEGDRARVSAGVERIRRKMKRAVPAQTDSNILIATFNFSEVKHTSYGRNPEAFYYVAGLLRPFDIVAVQEVSRSTAEIEQLLDHLGDRWELHRTGPTSTGGRERLAFLFNSKRIVDTGERDEIVLPASAKGQPIRTPFCAEFSRLERAITLCNVHIFFGARSGPKFERRVNEVVEISRALASWAKRDHLDLVLIGNVQAARHDGPIVAAIESAGFLRPSVLRHSTSLTHDRPYDQIALFRGRTAAGGKAVEALAGGAVGLFDAVYRDEDLLRYAGRVTGDTGHPASLRAYHQWRIRQVSDHKLLWAELGMR